MVTERRFPYMKFSQIINVLILVLLFISIIFSLLHFLSNYSFNIKINTLIPYVSIGIALISFFFTLNIYIEKTLLPISHNVAIIGFPNSGKTTMIISLFGEIFARNIPSIRATPKGTKTIEKINESQEKLKKGIALGPTQDQDRFAFRANITVERCFFPQTLGGKKSLPSDRYFPQKNSKYFMESNGDYLTDWKFSLYTNELFKLITAKRHLFPRTYKVEFGDFPGEDSEKYSNNSEKCLNNKYWLHNTEFFKWVVDCDAIIFVIDLGRYLAKYDLRQAYVAEVSTAFQAAWQHFTDLNDDRNKEVRKMPIILAFTKADLFGVEKHPWNVETFEETIMKLGFGDKTPPVQEISYLNLYNGESQVMSDFVELIDYFTNETSHFRILFISSFGLFQGKRLGISDLLKAVLP
jgi:hypothetical protein